MHLASLVRGVTVLALAATQVVASAPPARAATTWWVAGADPDCSDHAGGTPERPFCTLTASAAAATAGDTVLAQPATYREQVTVRSSGRPGEPVTFQAAGPGVRVVGTLDLSDDDGWRDGPSSTWSRSFDPPSAPRQVLVDGQRLTAAPSSGEMSTGTFHYDALNRVLHVDVGGANPGAGRAVEAGARTYGFNVLGRDHVVIDGFETEGQNNHGVRVHSSSNVVVSGVRARTAAVNGVLVESASGPVTVRDCDVQLSGSVGIRLFHTTGAVVRHNQSHDNGFHGIALAGAGGNTVEGNRTFRNRVVGGTATASGVDVNRNVDGSHANALIGNLSWENQDSGFQVYNGSQDNVLVRNVSHRNGDHGFDTLASPGTTYVSNTAYGNRGDGFSVEGGSTSVVMANNIAAENGLPTGRVDLFVDEQSTAGFSADHDLLWRPTSGNVLYGGRRFADLAAFRAATGHEAHGIAADPAFEAREQADLRLRDRSPAVDAGNTGAPSFRTNDADGGEVVDHALVPDHGAGPVTFADIGAYEYDGPVARLTAAPDGAQAPASIVLDATASTVLDGSAAAAYRFSCGDGSAPHEPSQQQSASCTYAQAGTYRPSVVLSSRRGQSSVAEAEVTVQPGGSLTAALSVSPSSGRPPLRVEADASASTDPSGIASYRFDCGNGTVVGPHREPRASCEFASPGTYRVTVRVTSSTGGSSTASRTVRVKRKWGRA